MSKPRRYCVFCDGYPLSHEHIWAAWMLPYLPKRGVASHEVYTEVIFPGRSDITIHKRSGELQSGRLRVVCKECNNGWMSDLQKATKPILLPLIQGQKCQLHRRAQKTLAAWIAMFIMVGEMMDKTGGATIAIKPWERRWLKEKLSVPPDWKIWLAHYEGQKWKGIWFHTTVPILGPEDTPQRHHLGYDIPNTQGTTAVFGKLYVHALSSRIRSIVRKQDMRRETKKVVPRLWPIRNSPLRWPPVRPLTDTEAIGIANAFLAKARRQLPATAPSP